MIENNVLIWLKLNIDETNEECQNILDRLQNVLIDNIYIFTNLDECVDFLTDLEETSNTFLIIGEDIDRQIMPLIHDILQLDQIYCLSNNKSSSCECIKEWVKVKGIYGTSTLLCQAIELAIKQYNQNFVPLSFVPINGSNLNQNLDQLEPTFMYTQIFKEILLEMKYDDKSIHDFVTLCQSTCSEDISPANIALFEKKYYEKSAIWWYTGPSSIYWMLNRALRTLQVDIIIKMGFFLSRLHSEIQQLHEKQFCTHDATSFIVYRGQCLEEKDFEKFQKIKNGLISFNSFLSTSRNKDIARVFAELNSTRPGMIGVLFTMSINSSLSSIIFADIDQVSYFQTEEEVLFSMHTIFRIIDIKPLNNDDRLYQIDLQLTSDDDEELRILTKYISNKIGNGTGWDRLANLLVRIGYLDKAEELYNILLEKTSNDSDRIHYYSQLSHIKYDQGDFLASTLYILPITEIEKKIFRANYPSLLTSHNNIDSTCCTIDECSRISVFYDKSSTNDHLPINECSNIVVVDDNTRQSRASFYVKALENFQRTLAPDQSSLSISSNNITEIFENTTEESYVLLFNEKLLEIRQKYLPPNHPDLALSYHELGKLYETKEEYSKASFFHQQSLKILEETLPVNHPSLAIACDNIALSYYGMKEYSTALSFYEKALQIHRRVLPPYDRALAASYHSIASLYCDMKEYPKALEFYEKALKIDQVNLSSNDPSLATLYTKIARIHDKTAEYSEALSFHKKALEIHQKILPSKHPDLAASFNNIGSVYYNIAEYSTALEFHRKAIEIYEETSVLDPPSLATCYYNAGSVYYGMEKYSEALLHFQRALELFKMSVSANDFRLEHVKTIIETLEEL